MNIVAANLRAFLIWLLPAAVVAIAVARVSVWIQPNFAPLVLFPLLIGAALGALLCGLMQITNVSDLRLVLAGTVVVALIAVGAEHTFFYLDHCSERLHKELQAGIPAEVLERPSFAEYVRAQAERDDMKIPLWVGNAALMVGATVGMVIWYVNSHHVGESLRDSHLRLGETQPRDANGTNAS